jgi:hypothetical protein
MVARSPSPVRRPRKKFIGSPRIRRQSASLAFRTLLAVFQLVRQPQRHLRLHRGVGLRSINHAMVRSFGNRSSRTRPQGPYKRSRTGPVSHQKRPRQSTTNTLDLCRNKSEPYLPAHNGVVAGSCPAASILSIAITGRLAASSVSSSFAAHLPSRTFRPAVAHTLSARLLRRPRPTAERQIGIPLVVNALRNCKLETVLVQEPIEFMG